MNGGIILFIMEGTSDKDTLIPYITQQILKYKIMTTVKIIGGDVTTKWINEYTKDIFECTPANIRKKIEEIIGLYLKSGEAKRDYILSKLIKKIYYVTDTDDCFFLRTPEKINKKNCMIKMFNFSTIKISKVKMVPIEVIFFAKDLEAVTVKNVSSLTAKEKEEIATRFSTKSLLEDGYFESVFRSKTIKTWDTYRSSYNGIKTTQDTACNMNNLLDEIEEWKK